MRTLRFVVLLLTALAVTGSLAACGKKGAPGKPDESFPHTYPPPNEEPAQAAPDS